MGRHMIASSAPLRFSVVISTYNRAQSLAATLRSLEQQSHPHLEVIVVVGPCTDDTDQVMRRYAGRIKVRSCPEANLSRSRNIGIDAASGDCVAFIDDDGIAAPDWIAHLARGYHDGVQGVGGFVLDHTGRSFQYRYSACRRHGGTDFSQPDLGGALVEHRADPFLYLQGTNASFRRSALQAIGGFNEQIAYYHDETDVCCRIIDQCGPLAIIPEALVLHKYAQSHLRDVNRVVRDPYHVVRSQTIFARQNGASYYSESYIDERLEAFVDGVRRGGIDNHLRGLLDHAALAFYLDQVDKGVADGARLAAEGRPFRTIAPCDPAAFLPFGVREPGGRMTVCFVSQEYPPGPIGGIGRFTEDLARGFAEAGHDVHVITASGEHPSNTDYQDGVWVHRLAARKNVELLVAKPALVHNYELMARVYRELAALALRGPIDAVSAPLWNVEGALAYADPRLPGVLTLMTSFKTVASFHGSWKDDFAVAKMPLLEGMVYRDAPHVQAISQAILEKTQADYGATIAPMVQYLCVRDQLGCAKRTRGDDGMVRILFVGRLERRKGVDVLLAAAERLLSRRPNVEVVFVGAATKNTELGGLTYPEAFATQVSDPAVRSRVRFAGAVDEAELQQQYANADIFCLPSRFESFGLVLLEASVFSLPLVGVRCGGVEEIIEHGETGLLVAPDDAEDLEQALERLVSDAELRQRFGAAARRRYDETFSPAVVVPRTIDYYRTLATDRTMVEAEEAVRLVTDRFAALIAATSALDAAEARSLAQKLLEDEPTVDATPRLKIETWLRRRWRAWRKSLRKRLRRR